MQLSHINRPRRGGRRHANYGRTLAARKQTLTDPKQVAKTYLIECACEPHCVWKCANELPDFVDHVVSLRDQRFAGADLIVAKRDHTFLLTVGFFGCFGGWRLQNSHPGVKRLCDCHLEGGLACWPWSCV